MPRQNKKHQGDDQSPLPVPPKKTQQITSEKYSQKSYASSPELDYVEEPKANTIVRAGKKRALEEEEFGPSGDFGSEMQKMFEVFGADISKTNSEKKKRMELLTQAAMKSTAKKVKQIWKGQQNERSGSFPRHTAEGSRAQTDSVDRPRSPDHSVSGNKKSVSASRSASPSRSRSPRSRSGSSSSRTGYSTESSSKSCSKSQSHGSSQAGGRIQSAIGLKSTIANLSNLKDQKTSDKLKDSDSDDRRPLGICITGLPARSSDSSLRDGLFHKYKKHGKVTSVQVVNENDCRHTIVSFRKTKLQEEYCKAESLISQWNVHIEKMKDQEEKLNNVFKQQQKVFQQARVIIGQMLKTIRQLNEQFVRGLDELEKNHVDQRNSLQSELKKEWLFCRRGF